MRIWMIFIFLILTGCTSWKKMMVIMSSNPQEKNPATLQMGEIVYRTNCLECHGATGKGDGPLAQSLAVAPANLYELAQKKSAKSFAANTMYGKNENMPAFKDTLSEGEIWHVANYIASWKEEKN